MRSTKTAAYGDWAAGRVTGGDRKTIDAARLAEAIRSRAYTAGLLAGVAAANGDGDIEREYRGLAAMMGEILDAVGMCEMIASDTYDDGFALGRARQVAWNERHEPATV